MEGKVGELGGWGRRFKKYIFELKHTFCSLITFCKAAAESVEHWACVREIVDSNPWSSQTNDLENWYLLLPSQVLGIFSIGKGMAGSVSG